MRKSNYWQKNKHWKKRVAKLNLLFLNQTLFRYIPNEYAESFVKKGEILFRALSYYRDYEDDGVRGDDLEGTRVHLPSDGLKITKVDTSEIISLPHRFESSTKEDDIFVYCFSTIFSASLAEKFKADSCVEIFDSVKLLALVRSALLRRPSIKNKKLVYGPIKYYSPHEPPIGDWALPDRVALSKPCEFSWQREYRIAFAVNGAFTVYNVDLRLAPLGQREKKISYEHQKPLLIKIGNISKLCKIHRF